MVPQPAVVEQATLVWVDGDVKEEPAAELVVEFVVAPSWRSSSLRPRRKRQSATIKSTPSRAMC